MIACVCNGVSERHVRAVAGASVALRPKQVFARLGCQAQCGRCVRHIAALARQSVQAVEHQACGAAQ